MRRLIELVEAALSDASDDLDSDDHLGWWVIHGGDFLDYLRRCHAGENPDLVYAEAYANCDHEEPS